MPTDKLYGVWCNPADRWTNWGGRNEKNPTPLTIEEAEALLKEIDDDYKLNNFYKPGVFEVRLIVSTKEEKVSQPTPSAVAEAPTPPVEEPLFDFDAYNNIPPGRKTI